MATFHLPRVTKFPITGEKSPLTVLGGSLVIPAHEVRDHPLIGKQAPEFELADHLGRRCAMSAVASLGRPVILFFFPLAGSPHCTKESCLFRDALGVTPVYAEMQAIVIGISQDPPERSRRFVDEHQLGFRILHDEHRSAMDAFGVGSILGGLIDQRCTFVIDPSGIVRAMAQGVFDAKGHIRFAERWLIRLEHELSQRARQVMKYQSNAGDLITGQGDTNEAAMRILYGDANSASFGGIDSMPRYGAAPLSSSNVIATSASREGNRWRLWRTLFSHRAPRSLQPLSDSASATEMARNGSGSTFEAHKDRSPQHLRRLRLRLPRSRSVTRLNQIASENDQFNADGVQPRTNNNRDLPPLPTEAVQKSAPKSDASDRETSGWTTESSLSSHGSTTGTSLGAHGPRSQPIVMPSGLPSQMVTSEVLMAADAPVYRMSPAFSKAGDSNSMSNNHLPFSLSNDRSVNDANRSAHHSSRVENSSLPASPSSVSHQEADTTVFLTPQDVSQQPMSRLTKGLIARQRQQAAESGDLHRASSLKRLEGPLSAPLAGQRKISAPAETVGSSSSTLEKERNRQSTQTGRLGQHRHASITDGIYRLGQFSVDRDGNRTVQSMHDNGESSELSSAYEYYQSLSPRPRSSRRLSGEAPGAGASRSRLSANVQPGPNVLRDGESRHSSVAMAKPDLNLAPDHIPDSSLVEPLDVQTPRAKHSPLFGVTQMPRVDAPREPVNASTGRFLVTRDQKKPTLQLNPATAHVPTTPTVASRTSSLPSPSIADESMRRPSYSGSLCSMGTFGRRESYIADSTGSETENEGSAYCE